MHLLYGGLRRLLLRFVRSDDGMDSQSRAIPEEGESDGDDRDTSKLKIEEGSVVRHPTLSSTMAERISNQRGAGTGLPIISHAHV